MKVCHVIFYYRKKCLKSNSNIHNLNQSLLLGLIILSTKFKHLSQFTTQKIVFYYIFL